MNARRRLLRTATPRQLEAQEPAWRQVSHTRVDARASAAGKLVYTGFSA